MLFAGGGAGLCAHALKHNTANAAAARRLTLFFIEDSNDKVAGAWSIIFAPQHQYRQTNVELDGWNIQANDHRAAPLHTLLAE
jgi:hypothetical protein